MSLDIACQMSRYTDELIDYRAAGVCSGDHGANILRDEQKN